MHTQTLRLGSSSRLDAIHKIMSWAKKNDKSFTITSIKRYYYAFSQKGFKKNFSVTVEYYSTKKEGKYLIDKDWNYYHTGMQYRLKTNQ